MSSTPQASSTASRAENGHGRSIVTTTTWLTLPVCLSFSLRRIRNRGTVQFGNHDAYSSDSFSTLRNGTSISASIGLSTRALSLEPVFLSVR